MTALSQVSGTTLADEQGLGALTLAGFISEVAERYPDNEALCWRDLNGVRLQWTFAEVYAESAAYAKALIATGSRKGSRVGILMSNRPEWIFASFGASLAGAIAVAMNTFSTRTEIEHQLKIADIDTLILERGVAGKNFVEELADLCPSLVNAEPGNISDANLPFLRRVVSVDGAESGVQGVDAFIAEGLTVSDALLEGCSGSVSPIDDGLIFFSSGSTAQPKAILQSNRAACLQLWRTSIWNELAPGTRCWSANGFFWSGNFAFAIGSAFGVGGCLVLQRLFQPDEAVELLQAERVNYVFAWPHQYTKLMESPLWVGADLSSLTYVDKNGPLATHPTVDTDWREPNGYGATETFTFVSGVSGSDNTLGSFGPILGGNTVRIIEPTTGEVLPIGETGEIVVKGPTLFKGYLKVPLEDTVDGDGFFHTADAGYITESGHLYWKGRLSDIIKTGGANVSPQEVDAVIANHPDLQAVFTVGIPDASLGELVVSCVIARAGTTPDEASVQAFAKQTLASYKVPRRVLFFTDAELPMTGSNKIQRGQLKELVQKRLAG